MCLPSVPVGTRSPLSLGRCLQERAACVRHQLPVGLQQPAVMAPAARRCTAAITPQDPVYYHSTDHFVRAACARYLTRMMWRSGSWKRADCLYEGRGRPVEKKQAKHPFHRVQSLIYCPEQVTTQTTQTPCMIHRTALESVIPLWAVLPTHTTWSRTARTRKTRSLFMVCIRATYSWSAYAPHRGHANCLLIHLQVFHARLPVVRLLVHARSVLSAPPAWLVWSWWKVNITIHSCPQVMRASTGRPQRTHRTLACSSRPSQVGMRISS